MVHCIIINMKIAIVSSSFYGFYEKALVHGAVLGGINDEKEIQYDIHNIFKEKLTTLNRISDGFFYRTLENPITFVIVPGALEIPQAINWLLEKKSTDGTEYYDGILALGCVIKGKTTHFEHVCNEVMHGISNLALQSKLPITSAIVTALNEEDANERVILNGKNLGKKGIDGLLEMIHLKKKITSL